MSQNVTIASTVTASQADIQDITRAISDYMLCWYGAGHEKLPGAINPTIVKRKFDTNSDTGNTVIKQPSYFQLVEIAKFCAQEENRKPQDQWRNDITIYDVFKNIASAKAIGSYWVDYIHLAKLDGQWQILHIAFDNPRDGGQGAANDLEMINQALLDYMESWYCGGHERFTQAVHPALVKRGFYPLRLGGGIALSLSTVSDMTENLRASALKGKARPKDQWRADITVFDVFQTVATAKAIGAGWVDYVHVAKVNGEWKLVNILYDRP
jgi:hypothetical protein